MSQLPTFASNKYDDGLTKQSFKDSTDINKILHKAQRTGTISHINRYGAMYGDFEAFDFLEAQNQLAKAREIFDALPSELRAEFDQDPSQFFAYANDPANASRLEEVLPEIAEPGRYFPQVRNTQSGQAGPNVSQAAPAAASEPQASATPDPAPPSGSEPQSPSGGSGDPSPT